MEGVQSLFAIKAPPQLLEYHILPSIPVKVLSQPPENGQIATEVSQVIWPSAIELGKLLAHEGDTVKGKTVIELGAGTGFLGLTVYLMGGAKSLLLTDGDLAVFNSLLREKGFRTVKNIVGGTFGKEH